MQNFSLNQKCPFFKFKCELDKTSGQEFIQCLADSAVWPIGPMHHLFSRTVCKGYGRWFEPGCCKNLLIIIIQKMSK